MVRGRVTNQHLTVKDSVGGLLNVLLPLLPLRRRAHPRGDAMLSGVLQLLASLLPGHARNQQELLRTDALMQLGHLLRCTRTRTLPEP